ncbi:hypothetical protein B0H17DRAFT_1263522 [Mycena rosella]|uniref:Uncharacterized protein n=1 Tax=Mycena rosella TaxID=1033263 RepID=A0AAD7CPM8_MYCRO|nr:hypothetical protein B0H17DRAFT_1263522 [Mycena rosella]
MPYHLRQSERLSGPHCGLGRGWEADSAEFPPASGIDITPKAAPALSPPSSGRPGPRSIGIRNTQWFSCVLGRGWEADSAEFPFDFRVCRHQSSIYIQLVFTAFPEVLYLHRGRSVQVWQANWSSFNLFSKKLNPVSMKVGANCVVACIGLGWAERLIKFSGKNQAVNILDSSVGVFWETTQTYGTAARTFEDIRLAYRHHPQTESSISPAAWRVRVALRQSDLCKMALLEEDDEIYRVHDSKRSIFLRGPRVYNQINDESSEQSGWKATRAPLTERTVLSTYSGSSGSTELTLVVYEVKKHLEPWSSRKYAVHGNARDRDSNLATINIPPTSP